MAASQTPRHGPLAAWNVTTLPRGTYSVRLKVWDKGGNVSCATVSFYAQGGVEIQSLTSRSRVISPNGDGLFDDTAIDFGLDVDARIDVQVFRIVNGQVAATPVRTLLSNSQELSGPNQIGWDGFGDSGSPVSTVAPGGTLVSDPARTNARTA